jgi:hypothetical protein
MVVTMTWLAVTELERERIIPPHIPEPEIFVHMNQKSDFSY